MAGTNNLAHGLNGPATCSKFDFQEERAAPSRRSNPRAGAAPMPDDILKDLPQRLESMVTRWSLVRVAHDASGSSASKARNELVLRYSDATRNYIRGIVRDEASAEETAQNAVLRMLSGDFAGADPNRGRFRDLLKVAAQNMVRITGPGRKAPSGFRGCRIAGRRRRRRGCRGLGLELAAKHARPDLEGT